MDSKANFIYKIGIVLPLSDMGFISCIKQSSEVCPPNYQVILIIKESFSTTP